MKVALCVVAALLVFGAVHYALVPLVSGVAGAVNNVMILIQPASGKLSIGEQH